MIWVAKAEGIKEQRDKKDDEDYIRKKQIYKWMIVDIIVQ